MKKYRPLFRVLLVLLGAFLGFLVGSVYVALPLGFALGFFGMTIFDKIAAKHSEPVPHA